MTIPRETGTPITGMPGYTTNAAGMSALELMGRQLYALRAQVDGLLAMVMREAELERLANGDGVNGTRPGVEPPGADPAGAGSHDEVRAISSMENAAGRVLSRKDIHGGMPPTFGGPKPAVTTDPAADPQPTEVAQ